MLGNVAGPIAIWARPVFDNRLHGAPRLQIQLDYVLMNDDECLFGQH
jgi:hypothetical protein